MLINIKNIVIKHKNIIMAIAVNLFFLILFAALNGFKYELSDDWFFAVNIADGHYNYTFCNYFIQLLSGIVQNYIYPINAFMLLQLIFCFISMVVIVYIFLDVFETKTGLYFVALIETAFAINAYSLITFTKTAAILIIAGGLMIFWAHCQKKNILYSFFGIVLAVLGSFYRFKIFYSVFVVFALFALVYIIHTMKKPSVLGFFESCKELLWSRFPIVLALLLVAVFLFSNISKAIIYSDDELDFYREYNALRSSVVDFQLPSFNEYPEELTELKISKNDLKLLKKWYLDKEGMAQIDVLRELVKLQENRQDKEAYIINMMKIFIERGELLMFLAYMFAVIVIWMVYKKKSLVIIGGITSAIGLLYLYLFIIGRCNYRTAFSIWFTAIVCLIYSVSFIKADENLFENKLRSSKRFGIVSGIFYVLFVVYAILVVSPHIERTTKDNYPVMENYINSTEDKIFALGRYPYLNLRNTTQFDNPMVFVQNDAWDKCVYFGTPYYGHPSYNELLKEAGVENLYTDLIDNDNLYFVDDPRTDDINKLLYYLNEEYGGEKAFRRVLVNKVDECFAVYKIISVDKKFYRVKVSP